MGKKKRSEEQKRQEKLKERKGFQNKINELGLGYEEVELPPDEVKRDDVAKSLLHTIKSLIPYTNEYYEALKAEDEMNDLYKIHVEKARAQELISKTRVGRHEEALEEMMDETNNDFYYFNKLKHRETMLGKFKYAPPTMDPFRFMSRGQNRLRKAVGQQFGLLDENLLKQLRAHGREMASLGMKLQEEKDEPCTWRGKDPDGNDLHCSNSRSCFLTKTIKNSRGKDVPIYTAQCAYHVYSCLGDHEEEYPPKVLVPNVDGLCIECFYHKHKHSPPKISPDEAPGVYDPRTKSAAQIAIEKADQKSEAQSQIEGSTTTTEEKGIYDIKDPFSGDAFNADSICCWAPNPQDIVMRGYICTNKVFYNAEAKRYLPMCAMHLKSCIKSHGDGLSVPIDIPNIHGLCNSHHIANFGSVPVPVPFPYPGVERKLKNKGWLVKPSHWGAPTWPPLKPRMCTKKYRPLAKPQTYIEKMQVLAREIRYKKRKKEFGRLAAIAIQAMFRGYRVRHSHKMILLKQKIPYRAERVVQIQCQMRRYLSLQSVKRRRILFHASALNIQKVYKGFLVRRWFKRNQAARVLQRAAKMWKDRHFFSTVMMMIQLKRLFQRRIDASIQIQRIIRGYLSRLHFSRYRQQILMKFSTSAMILQMLFKKHQRYLAEQRRLAKLRDKTKFMKKLASLVEELYFQRKERHRLKLLVFNAVPVIQALIRGYLGRSRGQRMKFLRKSLKTWCQPHYAVEFMREILENKIPKSLYVSENLFQLTTAHMTRSHRKEILLIDFLPHDNQHRSSVDKRVYLFTLTKYYEYLRKPLLISEVQSLYRRFRDPLDGKIRIIELSKYIRTHKQPCHKHGRTICGDCVYHRECTLSNCLCRCFIKDDLTGKVCKECHHAIALHTLLPLDLKPNRKKANQTLVKILEFVSEPDISLPTTIKGLELTDIGKQCYREKKRIQKLQITNSTTLPLSSSFSSSSSTTSTSMEEKNKKEKEFIHSISDLELSAEEICEKTEYWNEKNANLPLNRRKMNEKISITVSSYEPKTKLSTVEFWSNASKNPNKTVRDYHEKFDHNMPFPIVSKDDEIVYTLEGSRIYVELLKKLIILYEKNHKTGIDVDHGDFLKLILNHIQIFERHWRKMVIDIRTGQLNKHLILNDQYIRELYLSTAIPRPSMALQLDHAFRLLGFHKKVLGKDIIIQQYAEKKIIKEKNKRKTSLPMSSSVDNLGSLSHDTTTTTTTTAATTASSTGRLSPLRPILKHAMTARLPINTSDDMKEKSLTLGLSTAGTATAKSPILKPITLSSSSSSPSPKKEKFNKSEALVLASTMGKLAVKEIKEKEKEKETRGATANRHNFVRRGSDTDVVRPITQDEIHRIAHDVQIEPRGKYYHLISVDGRFICPFPACGATFTSREAAFQHLTTHEQKRKLQIPTPLSDSHLNYYWPKDNLWRDSKEYQKRTLPPGSIVCTVPGCKDVFASYHRLEYHLKRIHHIETKSQLLRSFYKFLGRHSRMTPPYPPPENLPTIFCSNHLKLNESCSNCLKILNSDIPKQPLYYYDRIKVDFRKRDGLGEEIIFDRQNTCQKGIIFLDSQGNQHRGRIKGILKDSSEDGWIACEELITIDYAQSLHQQVPYDSDHHHELVPLWVRDGSLDALAGQIAPPIWIRLLDVVTIFPLLEITKEEFIEKLRNREFKVHTYFIRPSSS